MSTAGHSLFASFNSPRILFFVVFVYSVCSMRHTQKLLPRGQRFAECPLEHHQWKQISPRSSTERINCSSVTQMLSSFQFMMPGTSVTHPPDPVHSHLISPTAAHTFRGSAEMQ
ncbi:hypothetical protein P7K49_030592 [Saguinus oedipus]|uniref:Secreted protein n=1 Tax=Saguinus oedipus TaxID=9490 RepID=A0ABQ9U2L5_SAGOE|nr:hypothetical protein P7K49_030592 [Saguinus oedipus]